LGQVTFSGGSKLSYFSFFTDQNVLIRVTEEGKIIEWGLEFQADYIPNYYNPKLQPYMGRVEYYGKEADSAFRGKVKSIGTCSFTYYNHYETSSKIGKLRTIGSIVLDYYDNFFKTILQGKLRFIGNLQIEYYTSFEDMAIRDKLKSIGKTLIKYHSSFDDRLIQGKVKSIGPITYTWYTSFDLNRYGLKSGAYRTNINGVTFILQ
jgi:hypothetical protein